jgi:diguanylate cyclase (GGDEF)-like protein/PAS domain S-box-containing protein
MARFRSQAAAGARVPAIRLPSTALDVSIANVTEQTATTGGPLETAGSGDARRDRRRAQLEALLTAVAVAAAVGAGVSGMWGSLEANVRENYRRHLTDLALAASQQVDTELHERIRDPAQIDTPDYRRAVEPLRRLRLAVPDVRYVYTLVRDGPRIRFILDAADPGDNDGDGVEDRSGIWDISNNKTRALQEALGVAGGIGRPSATRAPYTDPWGTFMTGYAPIYHADGRQAGVVAVDVDAGVFLARLVQARNQALLGLIPAGLLVLGLGVAVYYMRLRGLAAKRGVRRAALQAENAAAVLALERRRLANVIEGTGVGTWEWNIETGDVLINDRWAAMIGLTLPEHGKVTVGFWQGLLHPEDFPLVSDALTASFGGRAGVYEVDFRMHHAQGHWVWIAARGNVIERDADGRPLRMAGTHQDITGRKITEVALKQSEGKFRGLFELSPIGIALNDLRTGRFLEVNDALLAPTGYTREEFLALSYWDITPASYAADEKAQLDAMAACGRYGPYEKEYIRRDGTRYPVLLSGMRMADAGGREVIWSIVQDISQRKAMESELTEAARRDKLTGLANRTLFMERLHRALARVRAAGDQRFAVLFLDFDHFKLINDTLGHEAGDELLRQIADRLRSSLRAADAMSDDADGNLVARFGGDEFVILINDFHVGADIEKVAERLLNSLAPAYSLAGRDVHSTASIGIVTSDQCTESAEAVIRNADVAMYEAKRSGRACSVVFNEAMHTRLTRHVTIESGLRKALGTPELSLVYQPIVELDTGRMVSVEALLRWEHPHLGTISPAEFVPIAEETGLIVPLGGWVLQEACRKLAEWRDAAPERAPGTINVNVSRAELALGPRLLERIHETLERTGLPPHCLQLEVTEREVMRNPDASHDLMEELRAAGVRLAMDDFGTGTSSLACLRDYPFDTIKIDRSFVHDLATSRDVLAVIRATVTLVENLGMASVAEGVETSAQVKILKSLGCRYAQGYFYSRPVTADELLASLLGGAGEPTGRLPAFAS